MPVATIADVGRKVCEALGLPADKTASVLLRFEPGDVVKVEATLHPSAEDLHALGNVFAPDTEDEA